jgi:hypothetical protein
VDIGVFLGVFIAWPWLALLPAVVFTLLYVRNRRPMVLTAALAWLAYAAYEQAIKMRVLCSGECNIRVDLLLFYPLLALLTVLAVVSCLRARRTVPRR